MNFVIQKTLKKYKYYQTLTIKNFRQKKNKKKIYLLTFKNP